MTDYFADIPSEIVDTLQTDSTLNTAMALWMVGDHPRIPRQYFPMCAVIPADLDLAPQQETGFVNYMMSGLLVFEANIQDAINPDGNNKVVIASLTAIQGYMYRVRQVFKAEANVRLDAPSIGGDGYQITRVRLDAAQEIGAIERDNNFYNRGEMLWTVEFIEART